FGGNRIARPCAEHRRRADEEELMKQGGFAPQGKWTGNALGGVKAPEAILLPNSGKRFSDTASRLEALAAGHPMADWLRFMSNLALAQQFAATELDSFAGT